MFSHLEEMLLAYIHVLSLESFVFIASIVEEIIAPIPSPTVMVLAGSFAKVQEYGVWGLIPLAIIGAMGKTVGALVVYVIADKAEDIILGTLHKYINVSHADIEKLGSRLRGGVRDYVLLTFFRALPVIPSVVLSAGAGVLKVPIPLFVVSTFIGTILRDGFYLYAGYTGLSLFSSLIAGSASIENYVQVAIVLSVVGFLVYRKWYAKTDTI